MRWGSSSSAAGRTLLVAAAALTALGATCEAQDYTAPDRLVLDNASVFEPRVLELEQPFRGLNSIDYRITNTGDAESRFGLFAVVSYESDDDGEATTVERTTSRITEALAPGGSEQGRLYETELGLGERVHVEFLCFDDDEASSAVCSGVLELTVLIRQVDCRVDSDCSADEECDTSQGRCATSVEDDSGCSVMNGGGGDLRRLTPIASAIALLMTLAWWRRRS